MALDFHRTEKSSTPGLSVPCAECGRMVAYDRAFVSRDLPFSFFHEQCVPSKEALV